MSCHPVTSGSRFLVPAILAFVLLNGCATSRGILDVKSDTGVNPLTGQAVKITSVVDNRIFELNPSTASIPSLKGGEINDKTISSRAIARKRNSYGKALGDILLPEGRTVAMLAQEAVTRAFRESGYRVLVKGDAGYDKVADVKVDIHKFWAWMSPGFWTIALEFETEMTVNAASTNLKTGKKIKGYIRNKSAAAGSGTWLETVNKGLNNFVQNLKKELKQ